MQVIEEIKARLGEYPEVGYVEEETSLRILPADDDGIAIMVLQLGHVVTVVYGDGWNEQFTDLDEAVQCIVFGLSDNCRLKTTYRGTAPYRWVVEQLDDGEWAEDMTTAHFYLAFWRPKNVVYRQNRMLAWSPPR